MRKPLAGFVPKVVSSDIEKSVGAPVGGLNSRDPLSAMSRTDALVLDNFICRPTSVEKRKGQVDFVTGFGGEEKVWALFPYRAAPSDKMFAATDSGIYDVTTTGTVGTKVADSTNGKWESINGSNAGIHYLLAANGTDPVLLYNGTAWANAAITGITPSTITNLSQFKFRVFMCQKDTLSFWYLGVNAVQGAASEFPLAPLFIRGGSLLACGNWTIDSGDGPDDFAAFITTEGELAVYKGTDPSSAVNWGLVGVYQVPRPIGRKCLTKYGGDLLIITEQGLVQMSKVLQSVGIDRQPGLSDKVIGDVQRVASLYKSNFGWSVSTLSAEAILILNVPVIEGAVSQQFVMNTLTGSWSTFSSMNACCFLEMGARLFYGMKGKVVQALTTDSDFGGNMMLSAKMAFNAFGTGLRQKQAKLVRPNFSSSKPLAVGLGIAVNYELSTYRSLTGVAPNNSSLFDTATFDSSVWAGADFIDSQWRSVAHKPGYVLALMLRINDKEFTFSWNSTDFLLSLGSAL